MTRLLLLKRKPKQSLEKTRAQQRKWGLRTETRHPHSNSEHMFPVSPCKGAWLRYPSSHTCPCTPHLTRRQPPCAIQHAEPSSYSVSITLEPT